MKLNEVMAAQALAHETGLKHPNDEVHERVCWSCQAIYTGALAADGKCPNCRPKCTC